MESGAGRGGKIAKSRPVEKEGRADIGIERWQDWAFFCNDRIWLGLGEGARESGGHFRKKFEQCDEFGMEARKEERRREKKIKMNDRSGKE